MSKLVSISKFLPHGRLLQRLQNADFVQLFANLTLVLTAKVADIPRLQALWDDLQTWVQKLDEVFKWAAAITETRHLETIDNERENMLIIIFNAVRKLAKYAIEPDILESAQTIDVIVENYADSKKVDYPSKTAMIINMIQELELPENAAHLARIGQTENVALLKNKNLAFENLYVIRNEMIYMHQMHGSVTTIRKKIMVAFALFCSAVEGLLLTETDPNLIAALKAIIELANAEITQATNVLHRHLGVIKAKKAEKEKEEGKSDAATQTPDASRK